ncbi:hypothetical protein BKM14_02855 [Pseudomonas syringae pv. syringae]|nr:hypothetical protein BKM14_02855 [Pseudomonas syringae pv. syringae]POD56801.1 hypothetical protein BKM15_05285 [Pseudomonas syringae pv. syringae]
MQVATLYVVERTRSVRKGMRRGASHDNELSAQTDAELQHGVETIVRHAPAWECRSRRSASHDNELSAQTDAVLQHDS